MHTLLHTPLPWDWRDGMQLAVGPIADPEGDPIAIITGHPSEAIGNAALIARAVNCHAELLEACERMLGWFDCNCDPSPSTVQLARDIIAKATA